jgi:hypothetical protein
MYRALGTHAASAAMFTSALLVAPHSADAAEPRFDDLVRAAQVAAAQQQSANLLRQKLFTEISYEERLDARRQADLLEYLAVKDLPELHDMVRQREIVRRKQQIAATKSKLLSREVIPNPPIKPAVVEFKNTHREEIVVQFPSANGRPDVMTIPAGKSVTKTFELDPGSVIEEVYLVPLPTGESVEQVRRRDVPGKNKRYLRQFVVYENRVQSVVYDRVAKPKSQKPNQVTKGLRSIGVFSAGYGDRDQTIDVYGEAFGKRNPGAAGPHFQQMIKFGLASSE